jgi:hypothetical protein
MILKESERPQDGERLGSPRKIGITPAMLILSGR